MTKGNIIDMLGDGTMQFDEGDISIVRDGKEYDVLEVMCYGVRMSNKEVWNYEQFTQTEIDKIYKEIKEINELSSLRQRDTCGEYRKR